jgi:hypothetical protein
MKDAGFLAARHPRVAETALATYLRAMADQIAAGLVSPIGQA